MPRVKTFTKYGQASKETEGMSGRYEFSVTRMVRKWGWYTAQMAPSVKAYLPEVRGAPR